MNIGMVRFLALLLCLTCGTSTAFAIGDEFPLRGNDLEINVDSRWAGCVDGGYYPIRFRVVNRGPARQLTIEVVPNSGSDLVATQKSFTIDQNAKIESTLLIPMVTHGNYATFQVRERGRVLEGMEHSISLPEYAPDAGYFPTLLAISSSNVDLSSYEAGATMFQFRQLQYAGYSGGSTSMQQIEPTLLPDNWLAYSGLDLVTISLKDLQSINEESRKAILKWVQTGGNLVVYNTGVPAIESESLSRLLELSKTAATSNTWSTANAGKRKRIKLPEQDRYGYPVEIETIIEESEDDSGAEDGGPGNGRRRNNQGPKFQWQADEFSTRSLVLGKVAAFQGTPFDGTPSEWVWLMQTLGPEQIVWRNRTGISSRDTNNSFAQFFIPGVQSVPVIPFLLLITLFTIVIGPVNYIYFKRRRQLALLLISVPILAFSTTILLVTYSVVAHGFGVKSRVRSITVLDQQSNTAVTTTRQAMYAGMTLSSGMKYSPDTAVLPIWPPQHADNPGTMDWTETQSLQNGWLRSRTRTQFLTVSNRTERGRMKFESNGSKGVTASNGLEWDIDQIVYVDDNGKLFFGENVPAGQTASLSPISVDDKANFREALDEYPLELPKGMTDDSMNSGFFDMGRSRSYYPPHGMHYGDGPPLNYNGSLTELRLRRWKEAFASSSAGGFEAALRKNSYFLIMKDNPGINLGISGSREQASRHFLLGYF